MSEQASPSDNENGCRATKNAPYPLRLETALVTGASRGIGASVTRQLGQLGVNVAIDYRSKGPKAQSVANELTAMGREALLVQGDITNLRDVSTVFDRIRSAWGRLDVLVLNASGGWSRTRLPIMQLS